MDNVSTAKKSAASEFCLVLVLMHKGQVQLCVSLEPRIFGLRKVSLAKLVGASWSFRQITN